MRLKRLELFGFKSFPARTEIVFGEGITGIVGPNGSGKSNIADAVRWVLGEQSAKTLRGASMSDVIFNGTQKRKPQSYCEVALVFDNEDHALTVDFTEVMVTRRVYRTGESNYFINGSSCRLKDVLDASTRSCPASRRTGARSLRRPPASLSSASARRRPTASCSARWRTPPAWTTFSRSSRGSWPPWRSRAAPPGAISPCLRR